MNKTSRGVFALALLLTDTSSFTFTSQRTRHTLRCPQVHDLRPRDGHLHMVGGTENTWDRLTGPKLFKTVTDWNGIHSVPLVPLRIFAGLLMIHHGSEGGIGPANVGTPEFQGFVDFIMKPYFSFLPGSPELWAAVHDYAEFYGGILFAVGFLTRPAALVLCGTMLSAVYFHLSASGLQGFPLGHVSNYSYDFEEPLLYALIFLVFWFNGAGPLSVDSVIYGAISEEEEE